MINDDGVLFGQPERLRTAVNFVTAGGGRAARAAKLGSLEVFLRGRIVE